MNTDIYKQKLEAEKTTLEEEFRANGAIFNETNGDWDATPPALDNGDVSDENDVADRAEEYEERTSVVNTLEKRWHDVVDALAKIDAGTYGICEISGNEIEEDRLIANPAARTCKAHME
jgi:RNA polymerase-binding transcription factor DksA